VVLGEQPLGEGGRRGHMPWPAEVKQGGIRRGCLFTALSGNGVGEEVEARGYGWTRERREKVDYCHHVRRLWCQGGMVALVLCLCRGQHARAKHDIDSWRVQRGLLSPCLQDPRDHTFVIDVHGISFYSIFPKLRSKY
jgi:hypothetical protein